MKKKYLFFMKTGGFSGAEQVQMDYLRFIDYDRFSVTLGVLPGGDVFSTRLKAEHLPVEVVYLPVQGRDEGFLQELARNIRFLAPLHPDGIVLNQFFLNSFSLAEILAAFLASKGHVYMIVHDCPPVPPRYQRKRIFGMLLGRESSWYLERLFRRSLGYIAKKTIAVSRASCRTLISLHGFPPSRVTIVYNGVDIKAYVPAVDRKGAIRQRLELPRDDTVIISTARLHYPKRTGWIIEAFSHSARERKDIHLLIAGTGEEKKWLVTQARSLDGSIRDRIRFLGQRDDVPDLLQASDIYVLASETEGLSIACLEAMACGLVCVATDSGGMSEIIHDRVTGLLVPKSREGITGGLQTALALSPAETGRLSGNAREYVEDHFVVENNVRCGLKVLGLDDR